ncbi:hypothetical protein V2A60_008100 [Cordyceps javanica]
MLELNPLDYTVAWIAPLQIELEAALAALDKVHHGEFPHRPGDEHIFEAGEIESHNVVIGTIPASASYGTSAAVSLANELRRTFPNIRLTLVVGIAAAFPELPVRDIRLGDILVGLSDRNESAIVQYDLGKQTSDGFQLLRGGHALQPASKLASMALAKAERKARQNPDYFLQQYKTVRDGRHGGITFPDPGQETDHFYVVNSEGQECIANREPRPPEERTRVWKGVLGSGNTLLKDERGRHELQVRYKVIGVEMEAAGVLTELPAGVIRGVSDYGDKYKNDKWQLYAAAQAAAFAKLTLMSTPESRPYITSCLSDSERKTLHTSLGYDSMLAWGSHVKSEDQGTCQWLLGAPEYLKWLDKDESAKDFLWIKDKPGTGKSTLMKVALQNAGPRREEREGNKRQKITHENTKHIIIHFFFYGRGTDSQKSIEALYRSLLVQLLAKHLPSVDKVFKSRCLEVSYGKEPQWDEGSLQFFLELALLSLEQSFVSLFIDALDECGSMEVQDMVDFFSQINKKGKEKGIIIRFLLASRPYPPASCENCIEIDLISEAGHREDMKTWVKSRLRCLGPSQHARKIREKLIQKARGVFLWAVLVVREIQAQRLAWDLNKVEAKLQSMPTELIDYFERIVERDSIDQEKLILCLQWVLVARQQPLDARQLEAAIRFGADRERPTLTAQLQMEDGDEEDEFMAHTDTEDTEMEDIQNGNVQGSHMNYTQSVDTDMYGTDTHMQGTGIYGTFTNMPGPGINGTGINGTNTHMQGTDPEIPRILLTHGVDVEGNTKSFQKHLGGMILMRRNADLGDRDPNRLLPLAAKMNRTGMIRSLLEAGADTAWTDGAGYTPLMYAAQNGQEEVVTRLLAHNAQVNFCKDNGCKTALWCAVDASNHGVAKLLLSRGADIEAQCAHGKTPLAAAREREDRTDTVDDKRLGAGIHARDGADETALFPAAANVRESLVRNYDFVARDCEVEMVRLLPAM